MSLCEALLGERGEVSGAALAREALAAWQALDERGREEFFDVLAKEFAPAPEAVGKAADAYRYDPTPAQPDRAAGSDRRRRARSCSGA